MSQECLEDKSVACLLRDIPAFSVFLCDVHTFDVVFDYSANIFSPTVNLASAGQGTGTSLGADGALSGPPGLRTASPAPQARVFPGEFPGSRQLLPTEAGAQRPLHGGSCTAAGAEGPEPQGQGGAELGGD